MIKKIINLFILYFSQAEFGLFPKIYSTTAMLFWVFYVQDFNSALDKGKILILLTNLLKNLIMILLYFILFYLCYRISGTVKSSNHSITQCWCTGTTFGTQTAIGTEDLGIWSGAWIAVLYLKKTWNRFITIYLNCLNPLRLSLIV